MVVGAFVDKNRQPTLEEILSSVGPTRLLWSNLTRFIEDNYRAKGDLTFYGKNYGWALRFRKGGKALASLYPGAGRFTAQIVIGQEQVKKASSLDLGENARRTLKSAHQYPEGLWLFINVESERDLEDVKRILVIKSKPAGLVL